MSNWTIPFTVRLDQDAPFKDQTGQGLMLPGDHQAHTIEVTVLDHEAAATLTGTPKGFFTRADGRTVVCDGTRSGNVIRVTMDYDCYMTGPLRCVIRLLTDVENNLGMSLVDADFYVREGIGEEIIDPDGAFPTVQAQAERLEEVENQVGALDARLDDIENAPALTSALTLASGWTDHPDYPQPVRVVRRGYVVFLEGVVTNASAVTLDVEHTVTLATLPSWARPARTAHCLNQGTSQAVFKITAEPSGALVLSRYRVGAEWATVVANSYLCLTSCWLSSDATGSGAETVDDLEALIARMEAVATGAVRYNAGQSLTTAQQAQARSNIGVTGAIGASAVRYDATQSLTAAQKTRARGNIGAASTEDVEAVAADVAALESDIEDAGILTRGWANIMSLTVGFNYATAGTVDVTVISPTLNSSANYGCQMFAVNAGERYRVLGKGGQTPRLWAFTDANYLLKNEETSTAYKNVEITAPVDGYLFVNINVTESEAQGYGIWKYGTTYTIPQMQDDITSLDGRVSAVETRAANTVKYTAQVLSAAQQTQARTNTGAASDAYVGESASVMPLTWVDGYVDRVDGVVRSNDAYKCTGVISISDVFSKVRIHTVAASDRSGVAFYKDGVYLTGQNLNSTELADFDVSIPAGANQARFTCRVAYYESANIRYIETVPALVTFTGENAKAIEFAGELEEGFTPTVQLTFTSGRYIESSGVIKNTTLEGFALSQPISVQPGDSFTVSGRDRGNAKLYVVLDVSGNTLAYYPETTQNAQHTNVDITIPASGHTLYIGMYTDLSTLVQNVSVSSLTKLPEEIRKVDNKVGQMYSYCDLSMFSYIGICGDSYTEGNLGGRANRTSTSWGKVLGRMTGIDVTPYAKGGTTIAEWIADSKGLPALLADRAQQLYIFCFGINDDGEDVPLGTISDIHADYTTNPDTFYGNYGRVIDQVRAHAPNALLVVSKTFLPHFGQGGHYTYSSAAIEAIAEHYGIPYIETKDDDFIMSDLFTAHMESGHPFAAGYSGLAKSMYRLMNRLIDENIDYFNTFIPAQGE
ncbi:MAG: SGNH/GDSL hydrolase family protein [Oscillospiraceae bacterium]|nr:SGNH/GDSL hydrolase family protein [Oscillospiraceae bacterium]